uniref:DUF4283 domain-containing protein n=1 Tax=Salix viminalis TaxID=40686 RepID=A0A6N2MR19_SALVM
MAMRVWRAKGLESVATTANGFILFRFKNQANLQAWLGKPLSCDEATHKCSRLDERSYGGHGGGGGDSTTDHAKPNHADGATTDGADANKQLGGGKADARPDKGKQIAHVQTCTETSGEVAGKADTAKSKSISPKQQNGHKRNWHRKAN